ncbi:aminodeoxychorismate synthase component I [Paenibacillus agilis]|uniref:Aminodeoxychorismate synthase component I n=1 Tax=Paenibacillus agilis TaxID=3020863 RepID=A0A559J105_9BACL|nr:aminodeoxychorismate synthase component I [Paenibacillus agilis]TVX93557.1 aminodeoxychorismate synthase component I [Paenibacillus agilis]
MSEFSLNEIMLFDFANNQGKRERLVFTEPLRIFEAYTYEEVSNAWDEINVYVNKGYYAAGYVAYEAAPFFDQKLKIKDNIEIPLLYFGIYTAPLNTCKPKVCFNETEAINWSMSLNEDQYYNSIKRIKEHIAEGDTYQVNYSMRLYSDFNQNDLKFYEQLMESQNSKYSAYLNLGRYRILSASPELFFELDEGVITTRPMKGTCKRGRWNEEDTAQKALLKNSLKDRAENAMIVDLLRNDLSKIAKAGSVTVTEKFTIEKYPTVYQMTSTITASILDGLTTEDVFHALFPCGSITGAPKKSTMDIIAEIEDSPRGIYCGSIGYITPDRRSIFNVAIRTVMIDTWKRKAEYGIGGGITWNSDRKNEYEEALIKAVILQEKPLRFELLEIVKLEQGQFIQLELHLKRLEQTADFFDYLFDHDNVISELLSYSFTLAHDKSWEITIYINESGVTRLASSLFKELDSIQTGKLALRAVCRKSKHLFHNTTIRLKNEQIQIEDENCFETLLWNEEDELTEFTSGNLVVKFEGQYYTPPVDCGLLPDIMRAELLATGKISERIFLKDKILELDEIWMVNSLRGWVRIQLLISSEEGAFG